jgi:hypothetical protein
MACNRPQRYGEGRNSGNDGSNSRVERGPHRLNTPRLLASTSAAAQIQEPLIQPSEIRSENGVLRTTITAAPGKVQLGEFAIPGRLYNGSYIPPYSGCVLATRCGLLSGMSSQTSRRICIFTERVFPRGATATRYSFMSTRSSSESSSTIAAPPIMKTKA